MSTNQLLFTAMEKKLFFYATCVVCAICVLLTSCISENYGVDSVKESSLNEVYFFELADCPRSQAAKDYIESHYSYARIVYIDLNTDRGQVLLSVARSDYKLGKRTVSTPFICFGSRYIEGWDEAKQELLDEYIQPYTPRVPVSVAWEF